MLWQIFAGQWTTDPVQGTEASGQWPTTEQTQPTAPVQPTPPIPIQPAVPMQQVVAPVAPAPVQQVTPVPVKQVTVSVQQPAAAKPAAKDNQPVPFAVFEQYKSMVLGIERTVENIDKEVKKIKSILNRLVKFDPANPPETIAISWEQKEEDDGDIVQTIEGVFDGVTMIGDDKKKYPVPTNYASKSKLVPGDRLKLRIMQDGKMLYKLVVPIERQTVRAFLSRDEVSGKDIAIYNNETFFLNHAAVSYFKGKPGDEAYILLNKEDPGTHAAIEAILRK